MLKYQIYQSKLAGTSAYGWSRMWINENENDRSLEGVLCPQADGFGNANYVNARELTWISPQADEVKLTKNLRKFAIIRVRTKTIGVRWADGWGVLILVDSLDC